MTNNLPRILRDPRDVGVMSILSCPAKNINSIMNKQINQTTKLTILPNQFDTGVS